MKITLARIKCWLHCLIHLGQMELTEKHLGHITYVAAVTGSLFRGDIVVHKVFYGQPGEAIKEYFADEPKPARVPVVHRKCGGQVAWYLLDRPRPMNVALSSDIEYMDGTRPTFGAPATIECPVCHEQVSVPHCERLFEEAL
jgi:hypothetical protein